MNTPANNALIGPLYHGTRATSAKSILRDGFRRSRSRSYTGTGVCLTDEVSIAYEYGVYETGGCILEVWLSASTTWFDSTEVPSLERRAGRDAYDDFFKASRFAAMAGTSGCCGRLRVQFKLGRSPTGMRCACCAQASRPTVRTAATTMWFPTMPACGGERRSAIRTCRVFPSIGGASKGR